MKKISELRVVDLKRILEKRGLEKTGIKSVLVERLSKALTEEGHDPSNYMFDENEDANESLVSESSHTEENTAIDDPTGNIEMEDEQEPVTDEVDEFEEEQIESGEADEGGEPAETDEATEQAVELDLAAAEEVDSQDDVPAEAENSVEEDDEHVTSGVAVDESTEQEENTDDMAGAADSVETEEDAQLFTHENAASTNLGVESMDNRSESGPGVETEHVSTEQRDLDTASDSAVKEDNNKDIMEGDSITATLDNEVDQFVVHVDESDTNLDYDLGDKPEERDAPTPTKDESMDVDAADLVPSEDNVPAAAVAASETDNTVSTSSTPAPQATKSLTDVRADAPKKDSKDLAASQNLWISGLSSLTRATDLKAVFSRHGKVIGAKVVTNANRPGAKCYGYVTMSSSEEAAKCIQNLHRTELHGRMISVEKAKSDPAAQARAASARKPATADDKKKEESASTPVAQEGNEPAESKSETRPTAEPPKSSNTDDKSRSSDRHRPPRAAISAPSKKEGEPSKDGEKKPVEKEKKSTPERKAEEAIEREKRRLRQQERRARDDDYRRRTALMKEKRVLTDQQRALRMEEARMGREREKLRLEREKCKIEEMKLDSMQQERARLENVLLDLRQRVDREREELKRVETLRLEEMRRSATVKRSYDTASGRSSGGGRYDDGWESKRPATGDRYPSGSAERRGTSSVGNSDRGYSDRRAPPDVERRLTGVKEGMVARGGRSDDRYGSRSGGGERREYQQTDNRGRDPARSEWKQGPESRGMGRDYHESSSRRSGGAGGWSGGGGSTGPPSLLSTGGGELFSGSAAVQAAGMMMNAAMSRGSTANGTGGRYSGSGGSSGGGGYGGARRY